MAKSAWVGQSERWRLTCGKLAFGNFNVAYEWLTNSTRANLGMF